MLCYVMLCYEIEETLFKWLKCNEFARVRSDPNTYLILRMSFMHGTGSRQAKAAKSPFKKFGRHRMLILQKYKFF